MTRYQPPQVPKLAPNQRLAIPVSGRVMLLTLGPLVLGLLGMSGIFMDVAAQRDDWGWFSVVAAFAAIILWTGIGGWLTYMRRRKVSLS